jgi:hypothetical protein
MALGMRMSEGGDLSMDDCHIISRRLLIAGSVHAVCVGKAMEVMVAPGNGRKNRQKQAQGRAQPKRVLPDAEYRSTGSRSLRKNAFI